MKVDHWLYAFLVMALLLASSCDNIVEEIHVEADGSGMYTMYSDAIPSVRKMVTEMSQIMLEMDSTAQAEDLSQAEIEDRVWQDFPEEVDSILEYGNELPDSVWTDSELAKIKDQVRGFMRGGRDKGYLYTGVEMDFNDFDDLRQLERLLKKQQARESNGMGGFSSIAPNGTMKYTLTNRAFERSFQPDESPEPIDSSELMIEMFMGDAILESRFYLPFPVTKVTGVEPTRQSDREVVVQYKLTDLLTGKAQLDIRIEMDPE